MFLGKVGAAWVPGIALNESFQRAQGAFDDPIFLDDFYRVLGTRRVKPAAVAKKRTDDELINAQEKEDESFY